MSPAGGGPGSDPHAALARTEGAARARDAAVAVERLTELLGIVYRLRDPDGCPWDREQTLASMTPNLVEEVFETSEAVAADDDRHVAEELGDVLMNVFLMARIGEQEQRFDLAEVAAGIATKLVRRHPHVFGDRQADDAAAALDSWNESKQAERGTGPGAGEGETPGRLSAVPSGLPALLTALKLGRRAAAAGFDWPDPGGALDKLEEELGELREASARLAAAEQAAAPVGADAAGSALRGALEDELGDVLFAAVNVARKHDLDPEQALRRTIAKFRRRFAAMEHALGAAWDGASLDEVERQGRAAARDEVGPQGAGETREGGAPA